MTAAGAPFEELDQKEAERRVPALNVSSPALFEPASGVLAADHCLAALRHSAEASAVQVREHSRVNGIEQDGGRVHLQTEAGTISASAAIVCAGPWSAELLKHAGIDLHLVPSLEQVAYLSPVTGRDADVPVFIERGEVTRPWVYGLPAGSPGLLKVALHGAGATAHPDDSPLDPDPRLLSELIDQCARLLPAHHEVPVSTERCFYDSSSDGDFVIDRLGRFGDRRRHERSRLQVRSVVGRITRRPRYRSSRTDGSRSLQRTQERCRTAVNRSSRHHPPMKLQSGPRCLWSRGKVGEAHLTDRDQ